MAEVYLFDWGDTLMVDFPGVPGKMCDWDRVEAVPGAEAALSYLSQQADIYVATGAAESTEAEIEQAFARVGLAQYIDGYFCRANLGVAKGSAEFLPEILKRLTCPASKVTMVGDSLTKDIEPALAVGVRPIWLTGSADEKPDGARTIRNLVELIPN